MAVLSSSAEMVLSSPASAIGGRLIAFAEADKSSNKSASETVSYTHLTLPTTEAV